MKTITVSQLNRYVLTLLEADPVLSLVQVVGEISSYKKYPSGHVYFSLKDEKAVVSCVMFRSKAELVPFEANDGMRVVVSGKVTLYERDGKYQISVYDLSPDGIGELYAAFERLKAKLLQEGLFDEKRKKKIPLLPQKIGIITSPSGAVIRDVIHVLRRRFPHFHLVISPVAVQGSAAAGQIAQAVDEMNRIHRPDVLMICRGGGSLEDLWCFNEEKVARAVYASEIPVISAIGHETDFTICDFVADVRAPTPSAAAEIVLPMQQELLSDIRKKTQKLCWLLHQRLKMERLRLETLKKRKALTHPADLFEKRKLELASLEKHIMETFNDGLDASKERLKRLEMKMDHLHPMKVLHRGYALVRQSGEKGGKPVRSVDQISPGEEMIVTVSDGSIDCTVTQIMKGVNDYAGEK